jgi:rod shape-determining protein MreD
VTALGFLKGVGVFLLLVALHFLIRPLIAARVSIDFLVIAIVLASVRVRPGVAAIIGFFTGLITDSLTPLSLGAGALAMSAVASAASWLKAAVFGDNLVAQGIFLGLGKLAFDIMYLVFEGRLAMSDLLIQLLLWSPLSALVTGLTGVLVLATFRISLESRP